MNNALRIAVLAAGQSRRFLSQTSKVLHVLAGKPILAHVLDSVSALEAGELIVVASPELAQNELFQQIVQTHKARVAIQETQQGTADALLCALNVASDEEMPTLTLMGDAPLVPQALLERLRASMQQAQIGLLTMRLNDPKGYGRCLLDDAGSLVRIVEERDASAVEKQETLCYSGVLLCMPNALRLLADVQPSLATKELYITALVEYAVQQGYKTFFIEAAPQMLLGINTRQDLAICEALLQKTLREKALARGVTLRDPSTVFLSADTHFESDVVIEPFVTLGPGVCLEEGVHIKSFSTLSHTRVQQGAVIGPSAHLSENTVVGAETVLGNFVEVKRTQLGKNVKAKHLAYLGDAKVEDDVLIGAGAITCNFDGARKHSTTFKKGAFVGSNTTLVAPLVLGEQSFVAAGSTITKSVPEDNLAIARAQSSLRPLKKTKKRVRLS